MSFVKKKSVARDLATDFVFSSCFGRKLHHVQALLLGEPNNAVENNGDDSDAFSHNPNVSSGWIDRASFLP